MVTTNRLLPVGIQDFPDIRKRGFVYVDKTARAYELITGSGKAFFLSRPRRFGKSLLCSTLGAIFEGRRELFGEIAGRPALAIDSLDWEWKRHPVIRIDLNAGNYSKGTDVLEAVLQSHLENSARRYDVALRGQTVPMRFGNLIVDLSERFGEGAVVIIDEYDNPLTSTLLEPAVHVQLRNELGAFYGVLKSYDAYLRFVFLTGVVKFSHMSVFSALNNVSDISLDSRYADICGLTQEELESNFEPEIECILYNIPGREEYLDELRRFYGGYRFSETPLTVYNPFDVFNHFHDDGDFQPYSYWPSDMPTHLTKSMPTFLTNFVSERKIDILNISDMQVGYDDFEMFGIENMAPALFLYQIGYLTIADYDEIYGCFTLKYPNEGVRTYVAETLVMYYLKIPYSKIFELNEKLTDALFDGDVDGTMDVIKLFLTEVPYDIIAEEKRYFLTVVYLIFAMQDFGICRSEEKISTGRIGMLVDTPFFVYCFEFKLDGSAEAALAQIDSKEYAIPWTGDGKKVFKVGVNFDFEKKNIGEWVFAVIE